MKKSLIDTVRNAVSGGKPKPAAQAVTPSPEPGTEKQTETPRQHQEEQPPMTDTTTTTEQTISASDHEDAIAAASEEARIEGEAAGRSAERERIQAIRGGEEAGGREALADHLAFQTDDSAEKALAALVVSPVAAAPNGLGMKIAGEPDADLGPAAKPTDVSTVSDYDKGKAMVQRRKGVA